MAAMKIAIILAVTLFAMVASSPVADPFWGHKVHEHHVIHVPYSVHHDYHDYHHDHHDYHDYHHEHYPITKVKGWSSDWW